MFFGLRDATVTAPSIDLGPPFSPAPSTPAPSVTFDVPAWMWILDTASAALSGYHGYRRNNSLGWGIAWFALGGLFPIITPTIAFAQGFGKRKV